jgi:hypothetical protein
MDWQPIESARTDWSVDVDLWVVSKYGAERITDCRARLLNGKPDWHMRSDEEGWRRVTGTPTHWMPLPEPPCTAGA